MQCLIDLLTRGELPFFVGTVLLVDVYLEIGESNHPVDPSSEIFGGDLPLT